jgi:hypothetical protein
MDREEIEAYLEGEGGSLDKKQEATDEVERVADQIGNMTDLLLDIASDFDKDSSDLAENFRRLVQAFRLGFVPVQPIMDRLHGDELNDYLSEIEQKLRQKSRND